MIKKRTILIALAFIAATDTTYSQSGNINYTVKTLGGYTTSGHVPFWLRSNQFGSIPLDGASLSFIGSAQRDYDPMKEKLFDWGVSLEARANLGQGSNLNLIEGYGKIRIGKLEVRGGRSKKITGLCDTTLTSGAWAISGSNLGIPEVELSVRDFWSLPWFGQIFAFKGNLSHGWMGDLRMTRYIMQDTLTINSYLHQKSLYMRFGKPLWRLKLFGGFNHQVVWGNEQEYYLDNYTLTPLKTYFYVITGKRYSNGYISEERQGNHMGSVDLGLEYKLDRVIILLYRQNLYEVGGLGKLANIQDGLNGISIQNLHSNGLSGIWNKILFEFLYTKNQAGQPWSPEYGSPYEPYYNHGQYITGWSYNGNGLGNPFISSRKDIRADLPTHPEDCFVNNRVMAFHLGCEGTINSIDYVFKASWSKNYGTYSTSNEDQSTDISNPGAYGIFGEQQQFSTYLEMNRILNKGLNFGFVGAFDIGELYYNTFGLFLKASKTFKY